MLYTGNPLDIY